MKVIALWSLDPVQTRLPRLKVAGRSLSFSPIEGFFI